MLKLRRLFACFILMPIASMQYLSVARASTITLPQDEEIQLALESAPLNVRAQATVYVFGSAGYKEVRHGTNGFTCLVNRDGNQNGDNDLKPTCWDAEGSRTIVPVMLRVGELIARFASADDIKKDIEEGFVSGKFTSPTKVGLAYMLRGDVIFDPKTQQITETKPPAHYMIYAPNISNADIGTVTPRPPSEYALPSVYAGYSGGTRMAYIIIPAAGRVSHVHQN